ncbi:NAD(P)H-hydrate dehydratase [Microbacterium sp. P05]|uniref:ADP-dependent NAD(P)H-hydrate dehydratase n=1 Tax=Microbacterium sp. P05 TaxID=3366948 RepID=UPI003746F324
MMMTSPAEPLTRALLREWGLPDPGDSKKSRGEVIVVGGSRRSPGAVLLSGEAALRVGAGRVGLAVPEEIEPGLGLAFPEAGVYVLPGSGDLDDALLSALGSADAVLFGTGFADPDTTRSALVRLADADVGCLVLDAFALGVLADIERSILPPDLIINANTDEAALLLQRDLTDDRVADVREIAERFEAVVHCYGVVAAPDGRAWQAESGGPGLGTAGSGDILAGAITGFAALGVGSERAAAWGGFVHARAGDRRQEAMGTGFLAGDLLPELTAVIVDVLE